MRFNNHNSLSKEIAQFNKGIVLMLCDKFVKNESLNKSITNIIGGNMKVVEDYVQKKIMIEIKFKSFIKRRTTLYK